MTGSPIWGTASPKACRKTTGRAPQRHESQPGSRQAAGRCLLASVDAALPLLTSPTLSPTVTAQLVDDLRGALARTAARGDTCHVSEAADSVRLAANLLLAGSTDEARQALRHARTDLVDAPDNR